MGNENKKKENSLNEYGFVKDGKVYLKAYRNIAERIIGEVKDTEENALAYFSNRFSLIATKTQTLLDNIEKAENKGSYLMSLIHLKEAIVKFDALGPFEHLLEKLEQAELGLSDLVNQNRSKNKELKEELIEEAVKTAESSDWKETTQKLLEIKSRWIKIGKAEKDVEDVLELRFREVISAFFERKKAFYEDITKLYELRIQHYTAILEKTKKLLETKGPLYELKKLQEEWKTVGTAPKSMLLPIITEFKETAKNLVKLHKPHGPKINFQKWEVLCEDVEKLLRESNFTNPHAIKEIQEKWRAAGKLPPNRRDILNRFTTACDNYFELSYLESVMLKKFPSIKQKSPQEELAVKINLMKEFIRKEKTDIDNYTINLANVNTRDGNSEVELMLKKKLAFQNKRLDNKNRILSEFEAMFKSLVR